MASRRSPRRSARPAGARRAPPRPSCASAPSLPPAARRAWPARAPAPPGPDPGSACRSPPASFPCEAPLEQRPQLRRGPDQVEREIGVPRHVPVAHQHRHVRREPLRAERGGTERRGHRKEDDGAALLGRQNSPAFAAGCVHTHYGDVSRTSYGLDLCCQGHWVSGVGDDYVVYETGLWCWRVPRRARQTAGGCTRRTCVRDGGESRYLPQKSGFGFGGDYADDLGGACSACGGGGQGAAFACCAYDEDDGGTHSCGLTVLYYAFRQGGGAADVHY